MSQLNLFNQPNQPKAAPEFDGATYDCAFDKERLTSQLGRVFDLMKDGEWRTLAEIEALTGDPTASVSGSSIMISKLIESVRFDMLAWLQRPGFSLKAELASFEQLKELMNAYYAGGFNAFVLDREDRLTANW